MGNPIVSIEIGCKDKEATSKFYAQLFDWTLEPYGSHAVKFSTGAGAGVSGHVTALGHEPHHYTNFYVQTDDIEAHCKKAASLGAEVHLGPIDMPDGGKFAWLKDPEGTLFALIQRP